MEYIAHKSETGIVQTVKEHSENTARLSSGFAVPCFKNICWQIGLLHDIGKYQPSFQKRISHDESIAVEHSICGAQAAVGQYGKNPLGLLMALCIAGHHGGIPDCGVMSDSKESATLWGRLKRECEDYAAFEREMTLQPLDAGQFNAMLSEGCTSKGEMTERFAFFVRYCFSCLADADTLDTMHAVQRPAPPPLKSDFRRCLELLDARLSSFDGSTALQRARSGLQRQAFENIRADAQIYLMDMPTGSGKTLASMKCALLRAAKGKKRIIYVIPYNSIIDQTVDTFERLFGGAARILRHQSSFSYEDAEDMDEDYRNSAIYACENWDADIIVTTAVQFFESVYASKRGKLRKLHNMADSVLVFDEVHLMPLEFLQPCLRSIAYITRFLNSEAIFLTATMPDFRELVSRYALGGTVMIDLIRDRAAFGCFQKNRYIDMGSLGGQGLVEQAARYAASLIVVNTRSAAKKLYSLCGGRKYHLSTYMSAFDRIRVIHEIRRELQSLYDAYPLPEQVPPERRITVVSTSLIEAGVDMDFCAVFRECNGLDNLLQAGGRCNREGLRGDEPVFVFEWKEGNRPHSIEQSVLRGIMRDFSDISDGEAIREYYARLHRAKEHEITQNSLGSICKSIDAAKFRSYSVQLIDSPAVSIAIEQDAESAKLISQLRHTGGCNMRALQKYCCTVYPHELQTLAAQGVIEQLGGIYVLTSRDYYCPDTGIQLSGQDIYF